MLATVLVFVLAKGARFIFANNACLLASKTLFASLTPGKRRNDVIHASMGMLTIKNRKFEFPDVGNTRYSFFRDLKVPT